MVKRKRDEKVGEKEREWEETFDRSKKTPRLPIRKKDEKKDIREEVERGQREEMREMFKEQKEEIKDMNKMQEEKLKNRKNKIIGMLKRKIKEF